VTSYVEVRDQLLTQGLPEGGFVGIAGLGTSDAQAPEASSALPSPCVRAGSASTPWSFWPGSKRPGPRDSRGETPRRMEQEGGRPSLPKPGIMRHSYYRPERGGQFWNPNAVQSLSMVLFMGGSRPASCSSGAPSVALASSPPSSHWLPLPAGFLVATEQLVKLTGDCFRRASTRIQIQVGVTLGGG